MKAATAPPDDARDRVLDFEATPLDPYLQTFSAHTLPPGAVRSGDDAPYAIVLQRVTVRPEKIWHYQLFMVNAWRPWLHRAGVRMLAGASYLTGEPGVVLNVWRVPRALTLADDAMPPELVAHYRDELVLREETETLTPARYDPERVLERGAAPASGDLFAPAKRVYLIDTIGVAPGCMTRFAVGKQRLMRPLLEDAAMGAPPGRGWFLVCGGWRGRGGAASAVNVWSLPDLGALTEAMMRLAENTAYQRFVRATVTGEDQYLLHPMSLYDPRSARVDGRVVYAW